MNEATIAAIATPPGRGGIGIIRISGTKTKKIAQAVLGNLPPPRYAFHCNFLGNDGHILDQGLALYFPAPHSFTGEDVLELQGHGGPVILDAILKRLISLGATLAQPGEFSQRAFLNGKIDLSQAEAIADLIDAASLQAAQSALRSLQGEFSQQIHQLVAELTQLRTYIEAAIDFSDEDLNFLTHPHINQTLETLLTQLNLIEASAKQGVLLRDGANLVLAGSPNVGKSSLLNRLSGEETAIVTDIPGTTRDLLRIPIQIDGIPLHIIDTAGLRESSDPVEQEGIKRAQHAISTADFVLVVTAVGSESTNIPAAIPTHKLIHITNKIDLISSPPQITRHPDGHWEIQLSAKTGAGLELLRQHLKTSLGFTATTESTFSARRRHLTALAAARQHIEQGRMQCHHAELLAEELRLAQNTLAEITGEFRTDDLLGEIFSQFCVGK